MRHEHRKYCTSDHEKKFTYAKTNHFKRLIKTAKMTRLTLDLNVFENS